MGRDGRPSATCPAPHAFRTILGLTIAARYGPILLLSPYAGLLVDRYAKRNILLATQTGLGLISTVLGVTVLAGEIRLWQIFCFVIASLISLDAARLHPVPAVHRHRGQLRAGLRYAARVPAIARPLLMMGIVGTFTFEIEVSLPLLARTTFHGGSTTYSWRSQAWALERWQAACMPPGTPGLEWPGLQWPPSSTHYRLASSP
jgi:hypothetical protein